jgi:hypothetical protein
VADSAKAATKPKGKPSSTAPATPKRAKGERVDWEGMEPHYRANKLSLRELGTMYGVTGAAILKHARIQMPPWVRDQSEKINALAEAQVNAEAAKAVNAAQEVVNGKQRALTNALVVQATVNIIAQVRQGQRERFTAMAGLSSDMFAALRSQFDNRAQLEDLAALMERAGEDDKAKDKLGEIFRDVIALPGQIKAFKDLSDIITKLTDMETKAYKLEKVPDGDTGRANLPIRFVDPPMVERVDDDDPEAG